MTTYVAATAYGGPEVLAEYDEEIREPAPGVARVRVHAAGVNPIDVKLYSGQMGDDAAKLPMRLGFEVSGVVEAVGPGGAVGPAGSVSVGDAVIGYRVGGGYAEEVFVPGRAVLPRPHHYSWDQAAGLMLTGTTAVHALTATRVAAGETVLVHGAAGGVGLMAVQIARAWGATVIGTAGSAQHDLLRSLGAEPVEHGAGLAERVRELAPHGVQAAVDTVGGDEAVDVSLQLVGSPARVATIAAFGRGDTGIKVLGNGPGADPGTALRDAARMELVALAEEGALTVVVDETFPLSRAADAHRKILTGHTHGKIILRP
ncbi:NADP-dependent oxidoreductase [Rhodococcus sp. X156]|uniref:quinone oxidoreductase family protein n=1 Tax=Rhodococcus sp. X156 TaxID=2499145 RepID=UPI000FDC19C2|nr:NADP-dependent oxidoreductase [Rhodococcus sp. X156]